MTTKTTTWIKKRWLDIAIPLMLICAGFGVATGITRVAEARAEISVAKLDPLPATGPHMAAWALVAADQAAGAVITSPPAEGAIVTSPAPATVVVPTPVVVPDPVDNPTAFWELLLWAKKNGWPLAIAIVIAGIAASIGKRWAWLVQEGTRRAAIVGTVSMVAAAVVDALASGGLWSPVLVAVVVGIYWVIDPRKKPAHASLDEYQRGGKIGGVA